jgi:hypothetical protein
MVGAILDITGARLHCCCSHPQRACGRRRGNGHAPPHQLDFGPFGGIGDGAPDCTDMAAPARQIAYIESLALLLVRSALLLLRKSQVWLAMPVPGDTGPDPGRGACAHTSCRCSRDPPVPTAQYRADPRGGALARGWRWLSRRHRDRPVAGASRHCGRATQRPRPRRCFPGGGRKASRADPDSDLRVSARWWRRPGSPARRRRRDSCDCAAARPRARGPEVRAWAGFYPLCLLLATAVSTTSIRHLLLAFPLIWPLPDEASTRALQRRRLALVAFWQSSGC